MSASGRPVFVLRGAAPAFRDISPGTSGSDVQQLEEALARLGFDPGPVDGNYDQKTSLAVERMYQKAGWDAFGPTREQRAAVVTLERDWSDAARSRLAAETARDTAIKAVAAARAIAEQNIRQARIDSAMRFGTGRQLADARTGRSLVVETERARGTYSAALADADIKTQMADRALVVLDPRQTEMTKAAAEAKLRVARSAQRKARVEAALAIDNATREASLTDERIKAAEGAVKAASLEGERSVRAAQEQQTLAEFDVKVATERYERLDRELAAARAKLGVQVPADEVVFIPSLPIRVHEVTASVAGNATGPVMSVTDNELSIDLQLAIEAAPLVKPGMKSPSMSRRLASRRMVSSRRWRTRQARAAWMATTSISASRWRLRRYLWQVFPFAFQSRSKPPRARLSQCRRAQYRSPPTARHACWSIAVAARNTSPCNQGFQRVAMSRLTRPTSGSRPARWWW
ncbi:peptidoglycan-binding protein [Bradyrhizobium japonicum]